MATEYRNETTAQARARYAAIEWAWRVRAAERAKSLCDIELTEHAKTEGEAK